MVFDSLLKKKDMSNKAQNPAEKKFPTPADNIEKDMLDVELSFENELESPENLLSEDILDEKSGEPISEPPQKKTGQKPQQTPQRSQKIPAFISLDKYKEVRFSLREMKQESLEMRKTLENLKKNRDDGTELLSSTVEGLGRVEGNIDKIRGVLRT